MKAKPVRRCRIPAYPTRLEVLAEPSVLERNLPPGWRRSAELAGAVTVFLAANSVVLAGEAKPAASPGAAVVAPIFEHGDGRGAVGCIVVCPPVFLSEEEALQVIARELRAAGVRISKWRVQLEEVQIPRRELSFDGTGENVSGPRFREVPGVAYPLEVNLVDTRHKVAVVYVSELAYESLGGPSSQFHRGGKVWMSTVTDYDFLQAARDVAQRVAPEGPPLYFGTFYDPATYPDTTGLQRSEVERACENGRRHARVESRRLLREQVRDFVEWLKGQGVI